jgi:hypothetical protein
MKTDKEEAIMAYFNVFLGYSRKILVHYYERDNGLPSRIVLNSQLIHPCLPAVLLLLSTDGAQNCSNLTSIFRVALLLYL